jgi:phosphodiesterase/alkaline phosphatase D-like protein
MSHSRINRRQLLLGAAVTTAFAGLVVARETSILRTDQSRVALLDGMLSGDDLAQARALLTPLQPTLLGPDLLWQWRGELGQKLAKGLAAVAMTRWDKAMILSGLAREVALPVRQHRIGRSLFRTEIGDAP